ncbi:MAG: 4Fe-4S binding protein [Planctomycetota bacterium]
MFSATCGEVWQKESSLTSSHHQNLLNRLLDETPSATADVEAVLHGASAVALTEACIVEAAGLSASFPIASSARVFSRTLSDRPGGKLANQFGRRVDGFDAADPRSAMATAIGLALSGLRATAFLAGPDLTTARDELDVAVGRHVPLVLHLQCRAPAAHGIALGTSHEAYHACADAGLFQLFASDAQEAVDLALVARRTAELALVPGIVAMDGDETAAAPQDVRLPHRDLVRSFLGDSSDSIPSPTPAQRLLFGAQRRRVPRWHDLERPAMNGGLFGSESWALGAAAQRPFFGDHLLALLESGFEDLAALTGRRLALLHEHALEDARVVLVAQGAAVATACAVADHCRAGKAAGGKLKVGVLGVRCLRPFPGARVAELLQGKSAVICLERTDGPLSGDPPLTREVRTALQCAVENGRYGRNTHPSYPSFGTKEMPRLHAALAGLGGYPLRTGDLVALCRNAETLAQPLLYLGLDFAHRLSTHPKRQILLDALREAYPRVAALGLRSSDGVADVRPEGAVTVAVHRLSGEGALDIAPEAADVVRRIVKGQLRGRSATSWESWDVPCTDRWTLAPASPPAPLPSPGVDTPADVALVASPALLQRTDVTVAVNPGGALVIARAEADETMPAHLPDALQRAARDRAVKLYATVLKEESNSLREERLLGALLAAVMGKIDLKPRRVLSTRKEILDECAGAEAASRHAAFSEGFEQLRLIDAAELAAPSTTATPMEPEVPLAVRHIRPHGDAAAQAIDSLPRFWGEVGALYASGDASSLTPDPHLATGVIPPLSSTFRDLSGSRTVLPIFDARQCTGCGRCWSVCPDSAIGSVALSPAALIEAGMTLATQRGVATDPLRPLLSKLGPSVAKTLKAAVAAPVTAAELLEAPCRALLDKVPLPDDRKKAVSEAFEGVVKALAPLPLARTKAFFTDAEQEKPGTGELLSLAINPDACKACLACVTACEPHALNAAPQTKESVATARRIWNLWEELPDTAGETIARLRRHPDVGELPALLLSRHCQLAIAGGDGVEPGSGAKVALRLVLAAAEHHLQPQLQKYLEQIEEVRGQLSEKIRGLLAEALPVSDLEALAGGLQSLQQSHVNLAELASRVEKLCETRQVDTVQLLRLVSRGQELADLSWRLRHGPFGLGRARLGLVLAPDDLARGLGAFPFNPFQSPLVVDGTGEAAALARGLLEGQLREVLSTFALLRRSRLELANPREAELAEPTLKQLRLDELTDEERTLCPPLLVIAGSETFRDAAFVQLLDARLPVKVLLLSDASDGAHTAGGTSRSDLGMLGRALSFRDTFVLQSSLAHLDHLGPGLARALAHEGPAIIHLHAPSPQLHGFARDRAIDQTRLAVASRAYPLFSFDPGSKGHFGTRLDISGNPEANSEWVRGADGEILTPAHWAVTEERFAAHFSPLGEALNPIALTEYIVLPDRERKGKTPFITVLREEPKRLALSGEMAAMVERRARDWRVLQELCGKVTPFTETIRAEAEKAVQAQHARELEALRREYEQKIAQLRTEFASEAARNIKERLLALAGMGRTDRSN